MTKLTTTAVQFPVTYVQEHIYEMPRSKWSMQTGLPISVSSVDLAEAYIPVVRKALGRGQHIPQILVWQPDPPEHDFPLKEQAKLMDKLIQREHSNIPIEVAEVSEDDDSQIRVVYQVRVSEEQLLEEEDRQQGTPGDPIKSAKSSNAAFVAGALSFGLIAFVLMPKNSGGLRWLVGSSVGLLGGAATVVATKKGLN